MTSLVVIGTFFAAVGIRTDPSTYGPRTDGRISLRATNKIGGFGVCVVPVASLDLCCLIYCDSVFAVWDFRAERGRGFGSYQQDDKATARVSARRQFGS